MPHAVALFARARELAGTPSLAVDSVHTVADLRRELVARCPALTEMVAVSRVAVNHEFAADEQELREGDELALIPPVCGG